MKSHITTAITQAIETLQHQGQLPPDLTAQIHVERTRDAQHGDFACNIAMLLASPCRRSPLQLAEQIKAALPEIDGILRVDIAKPGFINFYVDPSYYRQIIREILQQGEDYGRLSLGQNQSVHIEMVSANPTGPLHVGHGRLAAYSASLANVLEAAGYQVHREYYVNDAGRQMRILAVSVWLRYLELFGETVSFPLGGYKGHYVIEIAKALKADHTDAFYHPIDDILNRLPKEDPDHADAYADALVAQTEFLLGKDQFARLFEYGMHSILTDIQQDLQEFGVVCQNWFHESQLEHSGDIARGIETLQKAHLLYEAEGAIWFRSTQFGDEKDRVVVRENGQPTYFASDIGYHLNKIERGFSVFLDVYGADHHGYAPRLQALMQALGADVRKLKVLLVQFAILYRGKQRVSMSTRAGEFVTLRELRQEVGNDAARFFYIMRRREQHLDFDLELAKARSSDNPVYYIQYAYARVCSVFRQLSQKAWQWDRASGELSLSLLTEPQEQALMQCLWRYPECIEQAATSFEPSVLTHYLQELAHHLHAYYNALAFLVEDAALRDARLCLVSAARQVLYNGLRLLGLSTPESM